MYYNVKPKYTPGSPGQVDQAMAFRVVDEERRCYAESLDGRYGERLQQIAKDHGLGGIVERVSELAIGWEVHDLITDERFIRPFVSDAIDLSGLYELMSDFENPTPDRRTKDDWRTAPDWKEGKRFVIERNRMAEQMIRERWQTVNEVLVESDKEPREVPSDTEIRHEAGYTVVAARQRHRASSKKMFSKLPLEFARALRKVPINTGRDVFDLIGPDSYAIECILEHLIDIEDVDIDDVQDLFKQWEKGEGPFENDDR